MTHLWPHGEVISMTLDDAGLPGAFHWHGQTHKVQQIANRWRIDEGWWEGRVWREYFKLTTASGWLVILYRDMTTGAWYLQRLYD